MLLQFQLLFVRLLLSLLRQFLEVLLSLQRQTAVLNCLLLGLSVVLLLKQKCLYGLLLGQLQSGLLEAYVLLLFCLCVHLLDLVLNLLLHLLSLGLR